MLARSRSNGALKDDADELEPAIGIRTQLQRGWRCAATDICYEQRVVENDVQRHGRCHRAKRTGTRLSQMPHQALKSPLRQTAAIAARVCSGTAATIVRYSRTRHAASIGPLHHRRVDRLDSRVQAQHRPASVESANQAGQIETAARPRAVRLAWLSALGVVFGDLGTSPLYTLQTVMGTVKCPFTPETAVGILSLIVWTLIAIISVKYCLLVMRADNQGEGGIFALMSLVGATIWRAERECGLPWRPRSGVDLRGRRHYACDFRAQCAGRSQCRHRFLEALRNASRGRDPARSVCGPTFRN